MEERDKKIILVQIAHEQKRHNKALEDGNQILADKCQENIDHWNRILSKLERSN